MAEQAHFDRHSYSLEGIASSVDTIQRLVAASEDGSARTPTLYPIPFDGEEGSELFNVNFVSVADLGHIDGSAKATAIILSEAHDETSAGKIAIGILVEDDGSKPGSPVRRLMTTGLQEGRSLKDPMPPLSAFKEASPEEADKFDDHVLYDVAFNLRALVEPWDVPDPDEQVPEALESLADSRVTIPGVSYMGHLLVQNDYNY